MINKIVYCVFEINTVYNTEHLVKIYQTIEQANMYIADRVQWFMDKENRYKIKPMEIE